MHYSIYAILILSTILALMCRSELRLVAFTLFFQYLISDIAFKYFGVRGDAMMALFCFIDFTALLVISKIANCANGVKIILGSILWGMILVHATAYFGLIKTLEDYFLYLNYLSGLAALFIFIGGVTKWYDDLVSNRHSNTNKLNRGRAYSIQPNKRIKK